MYVAACIAIQMIILGLKVMKSFIGYKIPLRNESVFFCSFNQDKWLCVSGQEICGHTSMFFMYATDQST